MQIAQLNLAVVNIVQMWTFRERVYSLNKARTKYVAIFLDENLTPSAKTVSSRAVVLNQIQRFVVLTFRDQAAKDVIHETGNLPHILDFYCVRYIRITSEDVIFC